MNKLKKRITAIVTAILLVVSMIPMGTIHQASAATASGKKVFYAAHLSPSDIKDGDLVASGTVFEDAFKLEGKARYKLAADGTVSYIEIARAGEGKLTFTVDKASDITLVVSSTGEGVSSHVSIVDKDGKAIKSDADKTDIVVSKKEATTLTFKSVAAGSYTVTAPQVPAGTTDDSYYRNFCFYGIKVVPEDMEETGALAGPELHSVVIATDVSIEGYNVTSDKVLVKEGTTFAAGFFKLIGEELKNEDGSVMGDGQNYFRTPGSSNLTSFKSIELAKAGSGKLQFTTTAVADAEFSLCSTGKTNKSGFVLLDSQGNAVENLEGINVVEGTDSTTVTYKSLPAGTYTLVSPLNKDMNRGFRIMSAKVTEEAATGDVELVDVEHKFDPALLSASKDKEAMADGISFAESFFKNIGTGSTYRINNDGAVYCIEIGKAESSSLQFTLSGEGSLTIKASSTGSSNKSSVALKTDTDKLVATEDGVETVVVEATAATTITYKNLPAGTYKIVSPADDFKRGFRLYEAVAVEKVPANGPVKVAKDWGEVTAPVITAAQAVDGKVVVAFNMVVGFDGADKVTVNMYDATGKLLDTKASFTESASGTVSFTPAASGTYSFDITASREGEKDVTVKTNLTAEYVLPLAAANMKSATSKGKGLVALEWDAVKEATAYQVYYKLSSETEYKKSNVYTSELSAMISALTVGERYDFAVAAVRGTEEGPMGVPVSTKVTADAQRVWGFTAYGPSTSLSTNKYEGSYLDGQVHLQSTGGKGKIQPATVDGLAFYYTAIDTKTENFKLTAKVHVNNWTYSNGQEGFGLMAADTIGVNGDTTDVWNNSYMAIVSKVEYFYKALDEETGILNGTDGTKTSMKLGIGALARLGATAENIADGSLVKDVAGKYSSVMRTLEDSMKDYKGPFNIIGNYTNDNVEGTQKKLYTDFIFTIEQNNTGYYVSYTNVETGETHTELFWDTERNSLTQIDKDHVYVGFFAARNADITISDMKLTTSNPATDAPANVREIEYKNVTVAVSQPQYTGNENCVALLMPNADGTLKVVDDKGNVIFPEKKVKADVYTEVPYSVADGYNHFEYYFTPDADFKFDEYTVPTNYNAVNGSFVTIKRTFAQKVIYVKNGIALGSSGAGTKENPADILSAFRYAVAGQIIVLANGEYMISESTELRVERGNDGTAEAPIIVMAELPDPLTRSDARPVINFQKKAKGVTFGGNYWILSGFDITNSVDGQKGLQLSGSHCVIQNVNAYNNGNTGIQISRYNTNDLPDSGLWPSYNTVLNCTSYNNADSGYEDADGFACKLTTGPGNIFDGCIAHHNADDGWDFYAKMETGSIGAVTIQNCVAYANGYLLDGTVAGNGNGFKMGGSNLSGHHVIKNSVAFDNKAKGVDCNSCPDIEVYNCTSFNNGSYNYAFYTGGSVADTAFISQNNVSYRNNGSQLEDQIKLKGTQNEKNVINDSSFFYTTAGGDSKNYAGAKVREEWFVSLDSKTILPSRNADGTINMNGLGQLTEYAAAKVGATINEKSGTATTDLAPTLDAAINAEPVVTPTPEPTTTPEPTLAPTAEPTPAPTDEPVSGDGGKDSPKGGVPTAVIVVIVVVAVLALACVAVYFLVFKKKGLKLTDIKLLFKKK